MNNKERIINIYNNLDRSYFMEKHKNQAHIDRPFPIGHEQTISQPSLVLKMTLLLDPKEDSKVLEIGTGSGYQTALLAASAESIYTIERIEELYTKAKKRLRKSDYNNINFKFGDGSLGWYEHAPYDRIIVTASAKKIPENLIEQLGRGGRMVIPVGSGFVQELKLVKKDKDGNVEEENIEKVRFVRLIED